MSITLDYLKMFWVNAPLIFAATTASQIFKLDILPFLVLFFICYIIVNYIHLPQLAVMGIFVTTGLVLGFTMASLPSAATVCAIIGGLIYILQLVLYFMKRSKNK